MAFHTFHIQKPPWLLTIDDFFVFSLSSWHQSKQKMLPDQWGGQTLPRGKRGLHSTGRNPGHAARPAGKQWTEGLCKEECSRIQGLLDWGGRHCEGGPVRGCQQPACELLQLGPLQEAADRQQEGELRGSVGGGAGKVARWGVPRSQKVHLRVHYPLRRAGMSTCVIQKLKGEKNQWLHLCYFTVETGGAVASSYYSPHHICT